MSNRALRTVPKDVEKPPAVTLTMREKAFNKVKELIDRCAVEAELLDEAAKNSWGAWCKKHLWTLLGAIAQGNNWLLDKVLRFTDWLKNDVKILTRIKAAWMTFFGDISLARGVETQLAANAAMT